jgi:hypothetical protein
MWGSASRSILGTSTIPPPNNRSGKDFLNSLADALSQKNRPPRNSGVGLPLIQKKTIKTSTGETADPPHPDYHSTHDNGYSSGV